MREISRRAGTRASFTPLLDPEQAGNGVHIHLNLLDARGGSLLYDRDRPACLSELGERFAAGHPAPRARAQRADRAEPRLRRAAATAPLERRSGVPRAAQPRGAAADPAAWSSSPTRAPSSQLHLEYRGADATANPYLALGAIVRAGLAGVREQLPAPAILDRDPAELDAEEAARFGVGALPATLAEALQALAGDSTVRGWMSPLLYEAYLSVKRAELEAAAGVDLEELCRRYGAIY